MLSLNIDAMNKECKKARILYLKDIFVRRSDKDNTFSAEELCDILLEEYGIKVERKAIYKDIEALCEYGLDIVNVRSPKRGYYLDKRDFEMAEVRLLMDAVSAAKFISPRKTKSLIGKIGALTSESNEDTLLNQVYVNSSVKCTNEELYDIIRVLNEAIEKNVQVQFDYAKRTLKKRYVTRMELKTFVVNPYALIWSNDHYYLICNNPKYNNLMHVRLDRINNIEITNTKSRHFSAVSKYKDEFDSADYANRLFSMFSGESGDVYLRCSNQLIDEILEKFGEDVPLKLDGDDYFIAKANVELSEGLVSWIMQYGENMQVINPRELRVAIRERAIAISQLYE